MAYLFDEAANGGIEINLCQCMDGGMLHIGLTKAIGHMNTSAVNHFLRNVVDGVIGVSLARPSLDVDFSHPPHTKDAQMLFSDIAAGFNENLTTMIDHGMNNTHPLNKLINFHNRHIGPRESKLTA